jgi:hypothetical protein
MSTNHQMPKHKQTQPHQEIAQVKRVPHHRINTGLVQRFGYLTFTGIPAGGAFGGKSNGHGPHNQA